MHSTENSPTWTILKNPVYQKETKKFQQGYHKKCNLRVQRNNLGKTISWKKSYFLVIFGLWAKNQTIFSRVVKTAFYVSRQTF